MKPDEGNTGVEKETSDWNAEIRTLKAQWIGVKEDNASLMAQIEYMNQEAKKSHERIMELEFRLKKAIAALKELILIGEGYVYYYSITDPNDEFGVIAKAKSAIERAKALQKGQT